MPPWHTSSSAALSGYAGASGLPVLIRESRDTCVKPQKSYAADLPTEISEEIASYLNFDDLKKIYSKNSLFLNRYLDAKYESVDLFPVGYTLPKLAAWLEYLSEWHIVIRVRHVRIRDASRVLPSHVPASQPLLSVHSKSNALTRALESMATMFPEYVRELLRLFMKVDSLTVLDDGDLSMSLCSTVNSIGDHQLHLLSTAGSTIRHLCLAVNAQTMDCMFALSSPPGYAEWLLKLESLQIHISNVPMVVVINPQNGFYILLRLLASSRSASLRSFSLNFDAAVAQSALFDRLFEALSVGISPNMTPSPTSSPIFPLLTHFSLKTVEEAPYLAHRLVPFLCAHQNVLTHLRIPPHQVTHYGFAPPPGSGLYLPPKLSKIEHIEIVRICGDYPVPIAIRTLKAYLFHSTSTAPLTIVLDDRYSPLHFKDLEDDFFQLVTTTLPLVNVRRSPRCRDLGTSLSFIHHLSLHLTILTPNHMCLLASSLPHLRSLQLRIFIRGTGEYGSYSRHTPFRGGYPLGTAPEEVFVNKRDFSRIVDHDSPMSTTQDRLTIEDAFFNDLIQYARHGHFDGWRKGLGYIRISTWKVDGEILQRLRNLLDIIVPMADHEVGNDLAENKKKERICFWKPRH